MYPSLEKNYIVTPDTAIRVLYSQMVKEKADKGGMRGHNYRWYIWKQYITSKILSSLYTGNLWKKRMKEM